MARSPRPPVKAASSAGRTRRAATELREQAIVNEAIKHFTRNGFAASTRDLAREIGVSQPALYRYFPSKDALIDRVYAEVFSWNAQWESLLTDRSLPLAERIHAFYRDYSKVILREEWIRIFIFAGLTREGINTKYLNKLRSRVFLPLLAEVRHAFGIPEVDDAAILEREVELVWSLHASIFYLGVRKWVYGLKIPRNTDDLITSLVDGFLLSAPVELARLRSERPQP